MKGWQGGGLCLCIYVLCLRLSLSLSSSLYSLQGFERPNIDVACGRDHTGRGGRERVG